jgi:hypothetical protein
LGPHGKPGGPGSGGPHPKVYRSEGRVGRPGPQPKAVGGSGGGGPHRKASGPSGPGGPPGR